MPFIPNEADAAFLDQAEPDAGDFDILANGGGSIGVVSGCAVTAQATPDMTVAVASGRIVAGALPGVDVTAGNLTIAAANATNPRFDLISVNSSGVKAVIAGTASTNPVFPAIPAATVILAAVYVPANDTAINANQIRDKRVFVLEPAALSNSTPLADGTATAGTGITASRGDHVHPLTSGGTPANDIMLPGSDMATGSRIFFGKQAGVGGTTANGYLQVMPFKFSRAVAINPGIEVLAAGSAGAVLHFAVWALDAGGSRPGASVADLGQVAATTTGEKYSPSAFTPTIGTWYGVGVMLLGAPATTPTLQTDNSNKYINVPAYAGSTGGGRYEYSGLTAASMAAALPAPTTISVDSHSWIFRLAA